MNIFIKKIVFILGVGSLCVMTPSISFFGDRGGELNAATAVINLKAKVVQECYLTVGKADGTDDTDPSVALGTIGDKNATKGSVSFSYNCNYEAGSKLKVDVNDLRHNEEIPNPDASEGTPAPNIAVSGIEKVIPIKASISLGSSEDAVCTSTSRSVEGDGGCSGYGLTPNSDSGGRVSGSGTLTVDYDDTVSVEENYLAGSYTGSIVIDFEIAT